MQAKLIVIGGKANKSEVVLDLPASIGRSRDADLTVGHRMISRKHCEAYLKDGLMMIRDCGSLNGTYVKGKRIHEAPLPPGAKFTIGPITFKVVYEYSGDTSNLPPIVPAMAAAAGDDTLDDRAVEASTEPVQAAAEPAPAEAEKSNSKPAVEPEPQAVPTAEEIDDDEPDFQIVEGEEDDFELAIQAALDDDGAEAPSQVAEAKQPAAPAAEQIDDDEPDFQIVEGEEDDFELAIQEALDDEPAQTPPSAEEPKKKPAEADPEDQLLDDFMSDLQ